MMRRANKPSVDSLKTVNSDGRTKWDLPIG